jgi:hypothetical protein
MKRYALVALATFGAISLAWFSFCLWNYWSLTRPIAPATSAEAHAPTAAEIAAELERRADDRREYAKAAVLEHPGQYLEFSGVSWYDKGIVNHYRELSSVDVTNHAPFPVRVLKADITWRDESTKTSYGTVPLALTGTVQPGETKHFASEAGTLDTTTLECEADDLRIDVRQVQLIGSAGVR